MEGIEAGAEGKVVATDVGDGYEVKFTETKRVYYVEKLGNVEELGIIEQDVNPGDITKNQSNQDLTGDSPETAYEVFSIEDLIQLSKMSNEGNTFENKYIKIGRDLNFKSDYSYADKDNKDMFKDYNGDGVVEGIKEEITKDGSKGFIPLDEFSGNLLGENKSIKNISLKSELSAEEKRIGLIRYNTGTIQNLNLTGKMDINVGEGKQTIFRIGGVCGDSEGKLSNIKNSIKISVNCKTSVPCVYLGGIAGYSGSPEEGVKTAIVENSYAIPQTNMEIGGMTNAKITIKNSETKSVEDMKKQEFVDLLNNGGKSFKLDTGNKNNGFPVLD